ncbi:MAG TPA: O-acetylhomoserine aminocarboxypropyltransferase/cysteine synthase family protein [Salinivirga sp.]|uniref:O-acetylhomoserine aminocarboxypropyltransferase/cysteine synthase family protein n=1 Tax=Salinivirga sp. TaxID=1970192 RepID=UPI002B47C7DC|nr:O-acetylhomoserine aminocarboxypropyltransferase/cysteine synthase family protein [Salinivirga sp.]HKK59179.1 O-acetylhomoserine aminocarboxypropyltransferase/cysteine synthase family protein [Salinivirga sp.]
MHFQTKQIHSGYKKDDSTGARVTPIYQSNAFYFNDSEHAKRLFSLEESGNIYSRLGNPTNAILESRIADMENGAAALAVASGHAAQLITVTTLAKQGDNIVTAPFLYGGTHNQFNVTFRNFGIDVRFTKDLGAKSFESLIDANTKAIYLETIGNPSFRIPDFEKLVEVANKYEIPVVVDNTFGAGGHFCRPIDYGAHIVLHSATKWIGGHGTSMGGIIIDGGQFDWSNERFPLLNQPSPGYHGINFSETFGELAFTARARAELLRDLGPVQSPFNSFMLLQGLETLSLRAQKQAENAKELAQYLNKHEQVKDVCYPGLENHPSHKEAQKYLENGYGAVLSFTVNGGAKSASFIIDHLELAGHMANVGDNRTLVIQPAITTHQQLTPEQQKAAGVEAAQIRVSCGIEHSADIINDFKNALFKLQSK